MKVTEQQIQEHANQIGNRPYHPVMPDLDADGALSEKFINAQMFGNFYIGITIRQELMRTAMASIILVVEGDSVEDGLSIASKSASQYADALLLEMARQELGVTE